jgi:pSer/pThr/pTyr-binding forkhead associated (FHA) protein
MELVIEELGRGDKVTHRHKYTSEQIVLGRCYTSDVIVDDLHVDPKHAKLIKLGDDWVVVDVSTVNGVKVNGKMIKEDANLVNGDTITIGKVSFRVVTEKTALKPTLPITFIEDIIDVCKKPSVLALNVFIFAFLYATSLYQSSYYEVASSKLLMLTMTNISWYTLPPIVAALTAFALRQTPNIIGQLGICFAMFNIITVFTYVFSVIAFSMSDSAFLSVMFTVIQGMLLLLLVWLSLRVSFDQTAGKRIMSSCVIFLLVFGVMETKKMSGESNFSSLPQYNKNMIPPGLIFKSSQSVDSFINEDSGTFKPYKDKN